MIVLYRTNSVYQFIARQKKITFYILALLLATVIAIQVLITKGYNNFAIFSSSFPHLLNHQNLYNEYPNEYNDLFLYNPTASLFFAPFHYIPLLPGLIIWLSINVVAFIFALSKLPVAKNIKVSIFLICLPDVINSLQHQQVNTISIAFILLTFIYLKDGQPYLAGLITAFCLFIKIYPAACGLFFFFFDNKLKFISSVVFWSLVIGAFPLLFISLPDLLNQYHNWFVSLQNDRTVNELRTCISLISIGYTWFSPPINAVLIQVVGLFILLLPLTQFKQYQNVKWQMNYVAAVCVFLIIFNHTAESATYIIAVTGIALWYYNNPPSLVNNLLLILVIVFTILAPTDIYPSYIKDQYLHRYSIRAVPCTIVWIKIIYDLFKSPKTLLNATSF